MLENGLKLGNKEIFYVYGPQRNLAGHFFFLLWKSTFKLVYHCLQI